MNRKKVSGVGFYVALALVILAIYMLLRMASVTNSDYNLTDLESDLQDEKVTE